ncbi:Agamous-like MADS-box protein AGL61 [Platanthera guangdongensis]|uniref:Agamous-like MADS-box protein AGL61 n=1 Tax=Platanthera guangdongensis TaxID=2320717 RepID=A0ABR2MVV2_9ASPA
MPATPAGVGLVTGPPPCVAPEQRAAWSPSGDVGGCRAIHGKPFSFGHPSLDHIIRRFISGGAGAPAQLHEILIDGDKLHHLNEEHAGLIEKLEEARRRRSELEMEVGAQQVALGLDIEVQQMMMEELKSFHNALEELRRNVESRREELEMISAVEAKQIGRGPGAMFGYGFGYLGGLHNGLYLPASDADGLYGQYGVPDLRTFLFWG